MSASPHLLLPTPRSLTETGGWCPAAAPIIRTIADAGGVGAYILDIGPDGIRLHGDAAGQRHGEATLAQLRLRHGAMLPGLRIVDAPAFPVRGVMLDISRDRVWTTAHLESTIDLLAGWKCNHLQLYTEHTFAYAGHEEVWAEASPLTAADVRHLVAYAAARGIALAANQNCFGHLERFLERPAYRHLAELPPGGHWEAFGKRFTHPTSLWPGHPDALPFVRGLLDQLLPLYDAPIANIGCDETLDLGWGRSQDTVAQRGRAAVYLEFVARICAEVRRHGKRPALWGDIALEHPEALAAIPEDALCLAWGYEQDSDFARWCAQLRGVGREVWVCPGTSTWCSFTGRTWDRQGNLLAAARDGLTGGATGFLATVWGDYGYRQQWPLDLHGVAEALHRAWSGTAPFDPRAGGLHAFGCPAVGPWLDALGDADLALRRTAELGLPVKNQSALFKDLHKPLGEAWGGSPAEWDLVRERLGHCQATLPPGLSTQVAGELRHACAEAQLAAERASARRRQDGAALRALAPRWQALAEQHAAFWHRRCRPGGLSASLARTTAIITELASA
jgi:hexosaminidase